MELRARASWTQAGIALAVTLLAADIALALLLVAVDPPPAAKAVTPTTTKTRYHWLAPPAARVDEGYVIALDPEAPHALQLAQEARLWLGVPSTRPFRAVNASAALARSVGLLPLYTRLTMRIGRHEHMQIGRPAALGCLLSHMDLWARFLRHNAGDDDGKNSSIMLVLEEDAWLDETSTQRLHVLLDSDLAHDEPWDILLLETGHINIDGAMRRVGKLGMTWANDTATTTQQRHRAWMGTRGYLLRASGARKLLPFAREFNVQVDALLGLVATFEPDFRMYWTRANVAHQRVLSLSTVHDWCIKCHMPQNPWWYVFAVACAIVVGFRKRIYL